MIKKGVIHPLSKAEKQGLGPQDIVPLKSHEKKRIQKAGRELRYEIEAPKLKTPEILKYELVLTKLQLPWT